MDEMRPVATLPESKVYTLKAEGESIPVYHTRDVEYAVIATGRDTVGVEATVSGSFGNAVVRPLSRPKTYTFTPGGLHLTLAPGERLSVELEGLPPLLLFCQKEIPCPKNATLVFEKGVHNVGTVTLDSGDCIYLAKDAVVCGKFYAEKAKDITLLGHGLIYGGGYHEEGATGPGAPMLTFVSCKNVRVQGVHCIDSPNWNVVPIDCRQVEIDGVGIVSIAMCGDGVDVVGSEQVRVQGCFMRTNDDCVAVKANGYQSPRGCRNVQEVLVTDCVLWNAKCGNALEIGYETCCTEISKICFEDIDILHCEREGYQSGGVFTIHNGDRAWVHDVCYRNIRVEDAQEKLIDFKILSSKYSVDKERGRIENVTLEDIQLLEGPLPPSIIRGYENGREGVHFVRGIVIRNLTAHGRPAASQLEAHLVAELAQEVHFVR